MKCLNRSGKQNELAGGRTTVEPFGEFEDWWRWMKWAPWRIGEVVVKVYFKWLGSLRSHSQFTIRNRFVIYCSSIYIKLPPFFVSVLSVSEGNPGKEWSKKRHPGILCHVTIQPGHISELWTWSGNLCSEAGRVIRLDFLQRCWNMADCVFFGGKQTNGQWRLRWKWPKYIREGFLKMCLPGTATWAIWTFGLHISWFLLMAEDLFSSIKNSHWK